MEPIRNPGPSDKEDYDKIPVHVPASDDIADQEPEQDDKPGCLKCVPLMPPEPTA